MTSDTQTLMQIFTSSTPLLDVRAPVEFSGGAVPGAINIPLLDDKQREAIGVEYAEQGQDAAIELGLKTATDDIRQARLQAWREFTDQHPQGYLYCLRGGLRSKITQSWLQQAGVDYPRIEGGYKAMRGYLISEFERLSAAGNMIVISAPTGSGKTTLINRLQSSIDLEGIARHRGSAFGSLFVDQPAQATWENQVAVNWIKLEAESDAPVVFESESQLIGRVALPHYFQNALRSAPVIELLTGDDERIENICHDYIGTTLAHYRNTGNESQSLDGFEAFIRGCLQRIQKRLGGERFLRLDALLPLMTAELKEDKSLANTHEIVRTLLLEYYDPLYAHKMLGREDQVVFRGSADEIAAWLQSQPANH